MQSIAIGLLIVGLAMFLAGAVLLIPNPFRPVEPQVFRLSVAQPGDYQFRINSDGTTQFNRVR